MNLPDESNFDLSLYRDDEKYVNLTVKQIRKDLSTFGIDFSLGDKLSPTYNYIFQALREIVEGLIHYEREKLVQLFYRIDLSENELVRILKRGNEELMCDEITALIIQRELKKVVIRDLYSQRGD